MASSSGAAVRGAHIASAATATAASATASDGSAGGRGEGGGRPSIFDILAQESLTGGLRPALKHLTKFLSITNPARYGNLLKWYEEIYTVLELLMENYYLKRYSGLFSENFYGMKRVALATGQILTGRDRLRSLLFMVLVPYLKSKLDRFHERLKVYLESRPSTGEMKDRLLRAFLAAYPMVNTALEASSLLLQLGYITSKTQAHSPWMLLSGCRLETLTPQDLNVMAGRNPDAAVQQANTFVGKLLRLLTRLGRGSLILLSRLLGITLFFVQFLDYYYNSSSDTAAQNAQINASALSVPKAPQLMMREDQIVKMDPKLCPICNGQRRNDTLLTASGYAFCYTCIHRYLQQFHCCPVTKTPADLTQLVRLFIESA